jgi:hypothetical protein
MVARSSRASLRAFTATSSREIMGLAVLEVTAREVRAVQDQQGHSLVGEVVQQTPSAAQTSSGMRLRNSPTFFDEKANASAKRRAPGKT